MSLGRGPMGRRSVGAARRGLQDRDALLLGQVEVLDNLVDDETVLKVMENSCHGPGCPSEHPGPAYLARYTLNGGAS